MKTARKELLFATRMLGLLMASSREVDIDEVFPFELAAYPPAIFKSDISLRTATVKSALKQELGVKTSARK